MLNRRFKGMSRRALLLSLWPYQVLPTVTRTKQSVYILTDPITMYEKTGDKADPFLLNDHAYCVIKNNVHAIRLPWSKGKDRWLIICWPSAVGSNPYRTAHVEPTKVLCLRMSHIFLTLCYLQRFTVLISSLTFRIVSNFSLKRSAKVILLVWLLSFFQVNSWLKGQFESLLKNYNGPSARDVYSIGWNLVFVFVSALSWNVQIVTRKTSKQSRVIDQAEVMISICCC